MIRAAARRSPSRRVGILRDALEAGFDLREIVTPVDLARYAISMDNDYLTPTGVITKQQHVMGEYTRRLGAPMSSTTATFNFTWDDVSFASTSGDESVSASQEALEWTFARGLQFDYYRPFGRALFGDVGAEPGDVQFRVGDWFEGLVRVPAVNLLTMLTWDIVMFEELNGIFVTKGAGRFGELRTVDAMTDAHVHLNFQGYGTERSTFQNGEVLSTPLGVSLINGQPAVGVEFRGAGRLNVARGGDGVAQEGESYFFGKVHLDLGNADLVSGDMTELLTVAVKNRRGKLIPLQKRRFVRLAKLKDGSTGWTR
jgi:hypothetical protein